MAKAPSTCKNISKATNLQYKEQVENTNNHCVKMQKSPEFSMNVQSDVQGPEPSPSHSMSTNDIRDKRNVPHVEEPNFLDYCQQNNGDGGANVIDDGIENQALELSESEKTETDIESKTETETGTETETDIGTLSKESHQNVFKLRSRRRGYASLPMFLNGHAKKYNKKNKKKDELSHRTSSNFGECTKYMCGITSKFGMDTYGLLKVYHQSGIFHIFCHCGQDNCSKGGSFSLSYFIWSVCGNANWVPFSLRHKTMICDRHFTCMYLVFTCVSIK